MRPKSLRIKSRIITCSAASFAEEMSCSRALGDSSSDPRGTVPLIGPLTTCPPLRRKKSSGDNETNPPEGCENTAP